MNEPKAYLVKDGPTVKVLGFTPNGRRTTVIIGTGKYTSVIDSKTAESSEVKVPNAQTRAALSEMNEMVTRFTSPGEMFTELEADRRQ